MATSSSDTLTRELAAAVDGEVRFDAATRALYATDASVYQIEPLGVVVPRSVEDVVETVRLAARHGVPITARGGGTSQAGQAIGAGLVVDTSKYLNRVLAVDPGRRPARVQPGVVLDELNAALKPHDLRFAPDVSSASRATVGGMIANNSSGARSVVYGKTIDHVRELTVVLADGRVTTFAPMSGEALARAAAADGIEGAAYREIPAAGAGAGARDRSALPEDPAPRRRLQPGRVRRSVGARGPLAADHRLRGHARLRARGHGGPGAAAEGEGAADGGVRRTARRARRDARSSCATARRPWR